ncbi:MAG TPA: ATP-dependent helicase [Candidatus Limnocylindrales bacterium]|jgi:superfamily I DNA/RNA helicase
MHPAVEARLARLSPDQLAAATAPPGPVLCVAPAGSGKTTTLVARIAWRLDCDAAASGAVCALTFNRRAAEELRDRLDGALEPLGLPEGAVRVRTFHALGLEILRDAGRRVEPLLDRGEVIADLLGGVVDRAHERRLDDAFSRFKLDAALDRVAASTAVAAAAPDDPARSLLEAYVAYEAELERRGGIDFDDLVAQALRALESDQHLLDRWRRRSRTLVVDEAQDLDRSQLRLALLLAEPANDVFLVGDDDQTIYAWRLADVRRILDLAARLPGLRRVDLVTNRRCPAVVVERSARLIARNRERFAKRILAMPDASGVLELRPDARDDVARVRSLLADWAPALRRPDGGTHAVLARTNRELAPFAAVALELDLPFRTESDGLEALDSAATDGGGRHRGRWAVGRSDAALTNDITEAISARASLQRPDARLVLATAHGTKGLEFDVVASIGLDEGVFPSARTLAEAEVPWRALEEERRLAYVAWTRARRQLVLLYDPGAPSTFVTEAFSPSELDRAWSRRA